MSTRALGETSWAQGVGRIMGEGISMEGVAQDQQDIEGVVPLSSGSYGGELHRANMVTMSHACHSLPPGPTPCLPCCSDVLQPMTTSLLAAPHSMTELKSVVLKTIITTVDILATPWLKVQAVIFALCTALNLYWHMAQLPYYTAWVNCLRCALYGVHAWVALCLVILMFRVDATRDGANKDPTSTGEVFWTFYNYDEALLITNVMWYGMLPAFLLCGLGAFGRLTYFFRVGLRFRLLKPDQKSRLLYKFSSDTDVEVISRVLRVWDEDKVPDPLALDLGEVILKSGIQQFPEAPFVRIAYANFLIECKQQMQSGWSQLEMARKMHPNISYRFSIFTWEQEQKQKAATSSSGSANADLVSYVEFQKNYKNLMQYHRAALVATRNFWAMLMHERISMMQLGNAFRRINMMEAMADKTYKLVGKGGRAGRGRGKQNRSALGKGKASCIARRDWFCAWVRASEAKRVGAPPLPTNHLYLHPAFLTHCQPSFSPYSLFLALLHPRCWSATPTRSSCCGHTQTSWRR